MRRHVCGRGGVVSVAILFVGMWLPLSVSAEVGTVTISASPATLEIGQPVSVSYTLSGAAATAHSAYDTIVMVNGTDKTVQTVLVGTAFSGTKTFTTRTPGAYTFRYRSRVSGRPTLATSSVVTVTLPAPSAFTLTALPSEVEPKMPITLTYAAPAAAHYLTNTIVRVDSTGRIVETAFVGANASGTKTFTAPKTLETYLFKYRLSTLPGKPFVATSSSVQVKKVALSRITNYPLKATGPVIAFGDSITKGRDASAGNEYVSLLSVRLGESVINAGISGDTTGEALARLDQDVLTKNPRLVLVFLGGNDLLQRVETETSVANMRTIVTRIQATGAAVLIIGLNDSVLRRHDTAYRQIAIDTGAAYAPDVMMGILGNRAQTTDLVHPRNAGHRLIADRIEPYLRVLLGI